MSNEQDVKDVKEESGIISLEAANLEIERLRNINKEVIESRDIVKGKLKAIETEAETRAAALLEEQGKFKELYDAEVARRTAYESSIKEREVASTLRSELEKVNALSVDTVMKLVDKSAIEFNDDGTVKVDSLKAVIKSLKQSDPILFGGEKAPDPKRAGNGEHGQTFETEIRGAKTQKEITAVLIKYGK
jgi:hypothetical protein